MRKRVLYALAVMAALAGVLAFTVPALASSHPARYPAPGPTATVTPIPAVTPPVTVNPFAGCLRTVTQAFTFDRARGRFIARIIPAIVCNLPGGGVQVYDLTR